MQNQLSSKYKFNATVQIINYETNHILSQLKLRQLLKLSPKRPLQWTWWWLLLKLIPMWVSTRQAINASTVQFSRVLLHAVAQLETFQRAQGLEFMRWPAWPVTNAVIENLLSASHYLMVSSSLFASFFQFFPNQHWYFVVYVEPKGVVIGQVHTTSFRVSLQAPAGNRGINRFEVSVGGGCTTKICTLEKSASPLQCQFGGLLPATRYTVNVRSCLPESVGCSGNVTILVVTTPNGDFYAILS